MNYFITVVTRSYFNFLLPPPQKKKTLVFYFGKQWSSRGLNGRFKLTESTYSFLCPPCVELLDGRATHDDCRRHVTKNLLKTLRCLRVEEDGGPAGRMGVTDNHDYPWLSVLSHRRVNGKDGVHIRVVWDVLCHCRHQRVTSDFIECFVPSTRGFGLEQLQV